MSTAHVVKTRKRRLDRSSNGRIMASGEFDAATDFDDRYSYELIHGVLIVSPPAGASERGPNDHLGSLLMNFKEDHPNGSLVDGTLPEQTVACCDNRRRADRVLWIGLGRMPDPEKDVPSIVVEFVSKRHRDRVRDYEEKRRDYLAAGVQEYWIIDRFRRIMTVYRRSPAEPAELAVNENDVYRTPLLPGFELPLARLLKVADVWNRGTRKTDQARTRGRLNQATLRRARTGDARRRLLSESRNCLRRGVLGLMGVIGDDYKEFRSGSDQSRHGVSL